MPKQILLVEDSVTIQRVVQIAFAREDYQISSTTGADEALARMKESRPDVVVVDAGLIGKSGYDLATAIKADPATKDVPVLLLTNNFTPYDEARGKVAGVDAFLAKPFDTQSIIDRVGALAKGKAAGATAASAVAAAAPVSAPTPAAAAPRATPVAVAVAAAAAPARPPASVPPPSASTPQGLGVIGRPTPAPVAMPPAPAAAAAPIEPPRATLMGMPTVQAMGTPNLRPPTPTPVAVKVRDIPATLTPAAPISAPAPVAATPVVAAPPPAAPATRPEPTTVEGNRMPEPVRPGTAAATAGIPSQVPQMPRPSLIPRAPIPATVLTALERIAARGAEYEAIAKLSVETIQQVAWEVVPELAEILLRGEVERAAKERRA